MCGVPDHDCVPSLDVFDTLNLPLSCADLDTALVCAENTTGLFCSAVLGSVLVSSGDPPGLARLLFESSLPGGDTVFISLVGPLTSGDVAAVGPSSTRPTCAPKLHQSPPWPGLSLKPCLPLHLPPLVLSPFVPFLLHLPSRLHLPLSVSSCC